MDRKPDKEANEQVSEAELERFLSGDSVVSKAYRELGNEEPPARLDRAILGAARDHVKPPGRRWLDIDLRFWRHWSRPITTVVIIGFCLSVVLQIMETTTVVPTGFNGDSTFSNTRESLAPDAEVLQREMLKPGTSAADAPLGADQTPPGKAENYPEEIRVNASRRVAAPQEMSVADPSLPENHSRTILDEIIVDSGQFLADDALAAWERGARPTADVWLAGIDALRAGGQAEKARIEAERLAVTYPDAIPATQASAQMSRTGAAKVSGARDEPADSDDTGGPYPHPETWLAGIGWLEEQKLYQRSAIERDKFAQIYPQYPERRDERPH